MSQTIKERVQEEVKAAMRAQEKERLGVLRLIMSEFKRVEVDERIQLDPTRELAILDKMLKQRRDSIAQFHAAGRAELVEKEQYEVDLIQSFMPKALTEAEIEQLIAAAIETAGAASPQDMGKVMAVLKPQVQGRADVAQVSAKVKTMLSQAGS